MWVVSNIPVGLCIIAWGSDLISLWIALSIPSRRINRDWSTALMFSSLGTSNAWTANACCGTIYLSAFQSLKPVNVGPGPGDLQSRPPLISAFTPVSVERPLKFQSTGTPARVNAGPSPGPRGPQVGLSPGGVVWDIPFGSVRFALFNVARADRE